MTCSSCGAELPAGSRFCPSCGQPQSAHTEERRVVTVLFADLVGFTAIAESMDPEAAKLLVDRGFERLVRDVVGFGGRVDKILGDAIVALFGAPIAHEDDAERAVRTALQMQKTMRAYAAEVGADVRLRIGVNTGEVLTGAMRSGGEYTAMGDVVNTASRLQSTAAPGEVFVGGPTYEATRDVIVYEAVGPVQVRNREELVDAHRAVDVLVLPGRRPRRRQTPLVGRDAEVALLRSAVSLAFRQERTQLVLLLGDSGVGKTRLADEVVAWSVREHQARVLESRCVPYGEANVWYPIGSAVRSLCGLEEDAPADRTRAACEDLVADALGEPRDAAAVRRTVASFLGLMGAESAGRDQEPGRVRTEASAALIRVLESLSERSPIFLRIADLHWADDVVLELVDDLVDGLGRSPVVLMASARHLIDERWAPRTGRHNHLILNLDPLDAAATELLLDTLLGTSLDEATRSVLLARSGGNPLFLEELVALVDRQGLADARPVEIVGEGAETDLPETLRGLIAARLDGLPPELRTVLDQASVIGSSGLLAELEVLCSVAGAEGWAAALDDLVDRELMEQSGPRWSFRSDVIREVAYGTLTKADRSSRHAALARWMADRASGPVADDEAVDRTAFQFAQAAVLASDVALGGTDARELRDRALSWLFEAARRARRTESYVLAARLCTQALDLIGDDPSDRRLDFLLGRAEARVGLFELAGARADVEEARRVAAALGDERGHSRVLLVEGDLQQRAGDVDAAAAALDDALARFRATEDRRGEAEALRRLGTVRMFERDYVGAEERTREALAIFEELEDRRGEAWALQSLAWVAYLADRVTEVEERIAAASSSFEWLGDVAGIGWSNALLAFTRFQQGRFEEAEQLAETTLVDATGRGDRFGESMMALVTALVRLWTGRTVQSIERAEEAAELFARIGDAVGQARAEATIGRARLMSGDVVGGFETIDAAIAAHRRTGRPDAVAILATVGLAASNATGDPDRAAAYGTALQGAGIPEEIIGSTDRTIAQAVALLQRGEAPAAAELLEVRASADGAGQLASLAVATAFARLAEGRASEALALTDRVHEAARSTYVDLATSYVVAGLAHAVRGDASEMIAAFSAARQELDATADVLGQAVVRLAEAEAAAAMGAMSARGLRREADTRLAELGITADGWRTLYRSVLASVEPVRG